MKLVVVSISKDESSTIGELVGRIPKTIPGVDTIEVIVVDDGSKDDTADIAHRAGARVISDNASKGLAFRFRQVTDIAFKADADILVNIDGDLQFAPEDIPHLIQPILDGRADFVAADRFTDPRIGKARKPKNMPAGKYWGNRLGAFVTGHLSRSNFKDVTCGFRAYNRDALFALNITSQHTYTQESFQLLALKRIRIETLPVKVKYFKERKSRVVTSIFGYILRSAVNILRAYRDFAPLRFFFALGVVPLVVGLVCTIFILYHWLSTGSFSPYKFVGFTGIYLISLGLFLWALGVVADMQVRILNNQEKTLEEIKRLRYERK